MNEKSYIYIDGLILEIEYHHFKVEIGAKHPYIITQCYVINSEHPNETAIGVSICSFRDQYDHKKGNLIARHRACTALKEKKSSSPIRESLSTVISKGAIKFKCIYVFINELINMT